jgi:hypothetical protein
MQIPFARRPELHVGQHADEYRDVIDAVERQSTEPTLLLQRMENRLVRHDLVAPDVLSRNELRRLRYILNFARLSDFEPGAASPGGRRGRPSAATIDRACEWGSHSVEKAIPITSALLQPTWWVGDGPAVPGNETAGPQGNRWHRR